VDRNVCGFNGAFREGENDIEASVISLISSPNQCAKMRLAGLVRDNIQVGSGTLSSGFFKPFRYFNGIIGSRLQAGDQGDLGTRVKGSTLLTGSARPWRLQIESRLIGKT